ncbi:hypothetical protein CT0861_05471 [Colletotrichum tofieldiae]|uniref:Secreted protein n=1 Tax=Colletotrichum tofieldiae TaxID=708197 RepID=A0A166Z5F9_9PEZI|nr:hypothetical protein CT0861_05471 [Colletotrichum tofieldiae]
MRLVTFTIYTLLASYTTCVATVPTGLSTNSITPSMMLCRAASDATLLPASQLSHSNLDTRSSCTLPTVCRPELLPSSKTTSSVPFSSRHSSSSFSFCTLPLLKSLLNSFIASPNASSPYASLSVDDRAVMARTKPSRRWGKSVSRTGTMRNALRQPTSCRSADHVSSPSAGSSSFAFRLSRSEGTRVVAIGLIFLVR